MIEIYKLLHGKYDSNTSNIINLYKDHNKLNERTRGHMWNFNFNLVQRALVLEDYAPELGVGGGLLVGKRVQEVWEKKRKKGKKVDRKGWSE